MRTEYHVLHQVGVPGAADSLLNTLKELTEYQNVLAHEMNQQLNTTIQAIFLQAFNMILGESGNEKNVPPVPPQANKAQTAPPEWMKLFSALQAKLE